MAAAILALSCSGCSLYMASTRAIPFDMKQVTPGTPEQVLRDKLGEPESTEQHGQDLEMDYKVDPDTSRRDKDVVAGQCMLTDLFFGVAELVQFPYELMVRKTWETWRIGVRDGLVVRKERINPP